VYEGPMSSERIISCNINSEPPINIKGIVSADLTKEQRVLAAVSGISKDFVSLVFNGEMFHPKNPIKVPVAWLKEFAQIESNL
jgi:hypothetical protein